MPHGLAILIVLMQANLLHVGMQLSTSVFLCVFLFIFHLFLYFFVPCGKFTSPYQGKLDTAATSTALPIPIGVCSMFMCSNNGMAARVWDFYVRTDADACDCTQGGCTDTVRECALEVDREEKRKIPCRTLNLNSHHCGTWLFSCTLYQLSHSRLRWSLTEWLDTGMCTMGDETRAQRFLSDKSFKGKELCWVAQATVLPHLSPLSSPKHRHPLHFQTGFIRVQMYKLPPLRLWLWVHPPDWFHWVQLSPLNNTPSRLVSLGTIIPTKQYTLQTGFTGYNYPH